MRRDDPPGTFCDNCRQCIDANEDAIGHSGRWFCAEPCRRAACLGEAEQLGLEAL